MVSVIVDLPLTVGKSIKSVGEFILQTISILNTYMIIPGNARKFHPWIHLPRPVIVRKTATKLKKKADEMREIPDKELESKKASSKILPSNDENPHAILAIYDHTVASLGIETVELKNDILDNPPPTDLEDTFNIQEILDDRIHKGKQQYKIRWNGYTSTGDTWEPIDYLTNVDVQRLISTFEESKKALTSSASHSTNDIIDNMVSIAKAFDKEYDEISVILDADRPSTPKAIDTYDNERSILDIETYKFDNYMSSGYKSLEEKHTQMMNNIL